MSSNILKAIANIVSFNNFDLGEYTTKYHVRINAVGEQLEYYLKDAFASSFTFSGDNEKAEAHSQVFAYLGNQNNPPDAVLQRGDAFEIKKLENPRSALALNNSAPKDLLYSNDPKILASCRSCDGGIWESKDLYYIVGYVVQKKIRCLFIVHGLCYAAHRDVYHRVHDRLRNSIGQAIDLEALEGANTTELGKVRRVDPLGITDFRIRGIWYILNPIKVFDYLYTWNRNDPFTIVALLTKKKYASYPKQDRETIERQSQFAVQDCNVKDPNNPAKRLDAKLIVFKAD